MALDSMQEIFDKIQAGPKPFWQVVRDTDVEERQVTAEASFRKMHATWRAMVESVDSLRLLSAIDSWGAANGKVTDVLLEYHIASEETKQGFGREEILDIVSGQGFRNVRIRGLMGMATFTDDENVIRADFARLMSLYDEIVRLRDAGGCPGAGENFDVRSFGMTHDYRIAVQMGADVVRIGTLIFGERA